MMPADPTRPAASPPSPGAGTPTGGRLDEQEWAGFVPPENPPAEMPPEERAARLTTIRAARLAAPPREPEVGETDVLSDPDLVMDIRTASNIAYFKGHLDLSERLLSHANRLTALPASPDAGTREREEAERWKRIAATWVLLAYQHGHAVPADLVKWADATADLSAETHWIAALRTAVAPTTSEETRE